MTRIIRTTVVIITEEIQRIKYTAALIVAGVRGTKHTIIAVVCVGSEDTSRRVLAGVVGTSDAVVAVSVYGREFTSRGSIACVQSTIYVVIT